MDTRVGSPAGRSPSSHSFDDAPSASDRASSSEASSPDSASPSSYTPHDSWGSDSDNVSDNSASSPTDSSVSASDDREHTSTGHPYASSFTPTSDTADSEEASSSSLSPLAGPASMAARREFNHAPINPANSYTSYGRLSADDFAGADDMRLQQLSRSADVQNRALQATLRETVAAPDSLVSGRAKTPFSTFNKLREPTGNAHPTTVSDIKDLSGVRVDVPPTSPDFQDIRRTQERLQSQFGDDLTLKRDYIESPNSWGYTGRVHSVLQEGSGLITEVQVGSPDISEYIEQKLTTRGGDAIALHDATGYKGQIYGVDVPADLQSVYADNLSEISKLNQAGQSVADSPALKQSLSNFVSDVEQSLPDTLDKPPQPEISTRAALGNNVGRGLGVLGIAGAAMQTRQGIETLRDGDSTVEGVANTGAGTLGLVSGGALLTGRVALGTATGGAVAVIDGGRDIYLGVRDADIEKTAVGATKAGAGTAMMVGVATANPLLIAGGAVVYTGSLVYENKDAIASFAKRSWNWLTS